MSFAEQGIQERSEKSLGNFNSVLTKGFFVTELAYGGFALTVSGCVLEKSCRGDTAFLRETQDEGLCRTLEIELYDKVNIQKNSGSVSAAAGFCSCPSILPFLFLEEEKSMGRKDLSTVWTSILYTEILDT